MFGDVRRVGLGWLAAVVLLVAAGCGTVEPPAAVPVEAASVLVPSNAPIELATEPPAALPPPRPVVVGVPLARSGDEIVVAGQLFHTGTPVVLWMDPGGYDGYRVERRFSALDRADWASSVIDRPALESPNRFGMRRAVLTGSEAERVRGGGWDLPLLQRVVDQLVLHYDSAGTSALCFQRLHDDRGLSIHFMIDVDGTIYQTLDLKERAWHATVSNSRSIGIEIAHIGAYAVNNQREPSQWYSTDGDGGTRLVIPKAARPESVRTPGFEGAPARPEPVTGSINGSELVQYDFTPEQYVALIQLTATLGRVFPNLPIDFPRDADGTLLTTTLSEAALRDYRGLIGHYHIQTNKLDPGPALQWDRIVDGARALLDPVEAVP